MFVNKRPRVMATHVNIKYITIVSFFFCVNHQLLPKTLSDDNSLYRFLTKVNILFIDAYSKLVEFGTFDNYYQLLPKWQCQI